jgi:acyl-CoA synthetase (NDP forming)
MDRIFKAESVAIIGASQDETKRGFQAVRTLLDSGFEGGIYPVNPKLTRLMGLACYPGILDIPEKVDVALITTPARTIPAILKDCGQKGVAGAVVIAAGFGETGEEGRELQGQMVMAARQAGVRVVGPNTNGLINFTTGLNLVGMRDVPLGDYAVLTQSGNMALHLITDAIHRTREGLSHYVGIGNESELKFHEYLNYLGKEPTAKALVMYAEGFSKGREFLRSAYEASYKKPIVLLKSGRSNIGQRSAGSHTGALAGSPAVSAAALKSAGVLALDNPDQLFPVAQTLARLPQMAGDKVAVLADGGGHATIAADLLSDQGLSLPKLSAKARQGLMELLPENASVINPVDVAGGSDANPYVLAECADLMLADEGIDALVMVGMFGGYHIRFADKLKYNEERTAHGLGRILEASGKPIIIHSIFTPHNTHPIKILRHYQVPVYDSLSIVSSCAGALARYSEHLRRTQDPERFRLSPGKGAQDKGRAIIKSALSQGRAALLEPEAKALLGLHGAGVMPESLAASAQEAEEVAGRIKGDVACKIVSADILHKTEAGGVRLGLCDEEVAEAFEQVIASARQYDPKAELMGCLIAPMAPSGLELIIGAKLDEQFGPVIMCGLGGIMVEVFKDVAFKVAPLTRDDAREMLAELQGAPLLDGVRGKPGVDKESLVSLLMVVYQLMEAYPEILELDLNPVIARKDGVSVVDARIVLQDPNK